MRLAAPTSTSVADPQRRVVGGNIPFILAISAVGLGLRWFRIGHNSFWADEVASLIWIRNSFYFLWTTGLRTDPTPPLYFSLLKAWVTMTGSQAEAPVRLLSAIASTAAIPLVFRLALEFTRRPAARLATILFALDPMEIYYGQEARCYALLPLLLSLSLLGLVRYAGTPDSRGPRATSALGLYGFGGALLLYTHATSIVTLAALNAAFLLHRLRENPPYPGTARLKLPRLEIPRLEIPRPEIPRLEIPGWRRLLLVDLLLLVAGTPSIWSILHQHVGTDWIDRPRLIPLLAGFATFMIDPVSPQVLFRICCILMVTLLGLFAVVLRRARLDRLAQDFLVIPPLLFLAITILVSFVKPIFIPRVTIWIPVPLCLLAGIGLHGVWQAAGRARARDGPAGHRSTILASALTGTLLASLGLGWHGVYVRQADVKEDWRGLTRTLSSRSGLSDAFVIGPITNPMPLNFYGELDNRRPYGTPPLPLLRWAPHPVASMLWLPDGVPEPSRIGSPALGRAMRSDAPTWIVLNGNDWQHFRPQILAMLGAAGADRRIDTGHSGLVLVGNDAAWFRHAPIAGVKPAP